MRTWIFLAVTVAAAVVADRSARRAEAGDSGGFWGQVTDRTVLILGAAVLLVLCVPQLLSATTWFSLDAEGVWLAAVGIIWIGLLLAEVYRRAPLAKGRWLAGSLEFTPGRHWLLLMLLPLAFSLLYLWNGWRLPGYAAAWAFILVAMTSVAGAAFSADPSGAGWKRVDGTSAPDIPAANPNEWPEAMASHGVKLRPLVDWRAGTACGTAADEPSKWAQDCHRMGSPHVSGRMAKAIEELMAPVTDSGAQRLILAPQNAGQVELVAMAITEVSRRYGELSIIVTPQPDAALAAELSYWLCGVGRDAPVNLVTCNAGVRLEGAGALLVDAETLSEVLIEALRVQGQADPGGAGSYASRVGLLVWWDLHEFSGVPAAHLWAISRRLERLLDAQGAVDRRVLALALPSPYEQAQYRAFLRLLLPYDWKRHQEIEVPSVFARNTHLYALTPPTRAEVRKAAEISALQVRWPTHVPAGTFDTPPPGVVVSPVAAGALFLDVRPQDVLQLSALVCGGGRSSPPGTPHHVVVTAGHNPYVTYLMENLATEESGVSAHLAVADGQPDLIRRHLLLALREVPDTFAGLRACFRWKEKTWQETLDALAAEGLLYQRRIRRLNPGTGAVERDSIYENRQAFQAEPSSLRVLGRHPVEVLVPDAESRLLMRVARERAAIEAYPLAVLVSGGQRFRINEWDTDADNVPPSPLGCRDEQADIRTWRIRSGTVSPLLDEDPERKPSPVGLQIMIQLVEYDETLRGVIELEAGGVFHIRPFPAEKAPLLTHFSTRALLLTFERRGGTAALRTIAAALRFVLPVHVRYDEDSLEIVSFLYEGKATIAIVDLFEGGIKLVDGLVQSPRFIPDLIQRTLLWLRSCRDTGMDPQVVLGSHPLIRATAGPGTLDFAAAVELLETVKLAGRAVGVQS